MNRIASFVILVFAGIFFLLSFFGSHGFQQLRSVNTEISDMRERTERLAGEISEIKSEIASFDSDDFALEKNAREELGLARSDEVVYIFPKTSSRNLSGVENRNSVRHDR